MTKPRSMCSCDSGTPCAAHRGTRHDPAYFDPQNELARPEEAPAESEARVGNYDALRKDRDDLRARLSAAEQALRVYADPKHWAVRRSGIDGKRLKYPDCVWIGPGATSLAPNAIGVARAALAGREETASGAQ